MFDFETGLFPDDAKASRTQESMIASGLELSSERLSSVCFEVLGCGLSSDGTLVSMCLAVFIPGTMTDSRTVPGTWYIVPCQAKRERRELPQGGTP